ncbi:type VII secretion protein EccB [Streptomyces sp. NPDC059740]|uniref:type VII secretion protein EccB n=1 Tax=Streptomyces sp. NPDC059740 TaxID=3346926 RepID=UPI00365F5EEF
MASRRDELNAYSFARKRTTAAFLKPLPNGSIESVPRPLRTILPSVVVGALVMVGFGACGILKPVAPQGWDEVGGNVLVGSDSTTRYVVLDDGEKDGKKTKLLHPVLNLASAKLLLDPDKYQVVQVKESELDGKLPHGPAVGIPYAPDRLPTADQAKTPKSWAVCDRPGSGTNSAPQQAVFVLGGNDKKKVEGDGKVDSNQVLYVQDPEGRYWIVDSTGIAMQLTGDAASARQAAAGGDVDEKSVDTLRSVLFGQADPQQVTDDWMKTVNKSPVSIYLPVIPGAGQPSDNPGKLEAANSKIGQVLVSNGEYYVMMKDGAYTTTAFVAKLLEDGPNGRAVTNSSKPMEAKEVTADSVPTVPGVGTKDNKDFLEKYQGDITMPWPSSVVSIANKTRTQAYGESKGQVSCAVYSGKDQKFGTDVGKLLGSSSGSVPMMTTWTGDEYPADIPDGESTYVTPGEGLLYRETQGNDKGGGSLWLVTDTGLRYSVPVNNDSQDKAGSDKQEQNQAQVRLGYKNVTHPANISKAWSDLLPKGPALDQTSARKTQSS